MAYQVQNLVDRVKGYIRGGVSQTPKTLDGLGSVLNSANRNSKNIRNTAVSNVRQNVQYFSQPQNREFTPEVIGSGVRDLFKNRGMDPVSRFGNEAIGNLLGARVEGVTRGVMAPFTQKPLANKALDMFVGGLSVLPTPAPEAYRAFSGLYPAVGAMRTGGNVRDAYLSGLKGYGSPSQALKGTRLEAGTTGGNIIDTADLVLGITGRGIDDKSIGALSRLSTKIGGKQRRISEAYALLSQNKNLIGRIPKTIDEQLVIDRAERALRDAHADIVKIPKKDAEKLSIDEVAKDIEWFYDKKVLPTLERAQGYSMGIAGKGDSNKIDPLTQEARKYKNAELTYLRNPEKSANMGSRFGQDIEPAGRYMSLMEEGQSYVPPGWETGKVSFKNPLVLDWGEGYTSGKNWKNVLSKKYGGKTGKELSEAIAKDGYDGIVTLDKGNPSEVVSLTDIWNKANAGAQQPTLKIASKKAGSQTGTLKLGQKGTTPPSLGQVSSSRLLKVAKNGSYDKSIPKTFDGAYSKFIADRDIAQVTATQKAKVLADIPTEKAQAVIDYREGVTKTATPEIKAWAKRMEDVYEGLHKDISAKAKQVGLDVGKLDNYVPHYWKESTEEVQQAFLSASKKPGEIKGRVIPTYKEGIKMGFTPRFRHPAQMLEQYVRDMERFGAGIDFIKSLKKQGEIIHSPRQGYTRIDAPGLGGGNMYARTSVAQQISRLLSPESQTGIGDFFAKSAGFSGGLQDITLSGGLPGTPINAFTIAQIQKELLAANVVSPFKALATSMSTQKTQQFFDTNADQVKKMLARNVPVRSGYGVDEMIDQTTAKRIFGDGIGNAWGKLINEPTFKRFMPMLQVNLFNQIEVSAIKSGMSEKQAADVAAESVRKFYGLVDTAKSAKRSKIGKDITGTFLFAPHYRESMVNMWVETVKALKNPLAKENQMNVRFAIGALATYITMDQINQQFNGHGLNDNPEGKKDKLLIPLEDGYTLGIPFLSSIATIPRMGVEMVRQTAQGDITGAAAEGRKTLAMAIKPLVDVMANSDHFERSIVEETDTPSEKLKKQGEYLLKSYIGHPYVRELIELYTKPEKPVYQRLTNAMELPLRFYTTESIELAPFWEKYSKMKLIQERYDSMKYDNPAKANDYLNEHEDDINELNLMKAYLKANYDQQEGGLEQTSLKEYLALAKTESEYEVSDDAPKTEAEKKALTIKSAVTNPIDTYNAYKSGQPIRKMRGDATVLERQLGPTDKNKDTQKDHRIPLWAGGTNEDKNTYYLSNADHAAKTAFEKPLRDKLENGELNKSQVQKQINQWHKDNNIESVAPPVKKPTLRVTDKKDGVTGETYSYTDAKGTVKELSIEPPTEPKYTGSKALDDKMRSQYNSKITTAGNNVIKLYEQGSLTKEEAIKAMDALVALKKTSTAKGKKGRKGKKAPAVKLAKVKAIKVPKVKIKFGKLPKPKKAKKLSLASKSLLTGSKNEYRIKV